jgi:fructokinase
MDIVCLGELLVDMFPAELGRRLAAVSAFYPKPGGAPANVAVAAARLGAQSAFIGKVGDEAFGRHLAQILADEGVETRGMRFDRHARTALAFIAKPDENTSEFVFYRNPGADMLLRPDELDRDVLQSTCAFHFGSISLIQEPSRGATMEAIAIARRAGALISFDVNYRPSLWRSAEQARACVLECLPCVDLLKVNEVEVALLAAEGGSGEGMLFSLSDLDAPAKLLLDRGPDLVVVTLGSEGSHFRTADGGAYVSPFRVQTVDATGCGDAFVAALLCQLVREGWRGSGGSVRLSPTRLCEILRYANAVGALTSLKQGVIPALPSVAEVDAFLDRYA